jgi:hypothetical protein
MLLSLKKRQESTTEEILDAFSSEGCAKGKSKGKQGWLCGFSSLNAKLLCVHSH